MNTKKRYAVIKTIVHGHGTDENIEPNGSERYEINWFTTKREALNWLTTKDTQFQSESEGELSRYCCRIERQIGK